MTDPERAGSPVTRRGPGSSSSCTPTTSSLGAVANRAIARWSLTLGTKVNPAQALLCLHDVAG